MIDLTKAANSVNIASELDKQELTAIGQRILLGFREDENSVSEWMADIKIIEDLASMHSKTKNTPLPNSSNVKLPIITKACYEFSSTTYPEIVKDDKVVQAYILGKDMDGSKAKAAKKVTDFMNFQILIEQQDWELDLNRLLFLLALYGFVCKKTYYDPVCDKIKSEICKPKELIIHSNAMSLEDAARISHVLHMRLNDLISNKNKKINGIPVYLEETVAELEMMFATDALDKPIDVIEQHCKLDLDKDGYAEPYIVTIVKETGCVLRIVARFTKDDIIKESGTVVYIKPTKYFADYHFLPSPKGHFQSVGFGLLLLHITGSANSAINSLMDAAQLCNLRGGFMDARCKIMPSGNSLHDPGEWKLTKVQTGATLKDSLLPIDYKEPSEVMYKLLGLLIDVARDLTASAEINNGTQSSENAKTGATIALQNEGKKMVTSINKGLYRSLTIEMRQRFDLNSVYMDINVEKATYSKTPNVGKLLEISQKDFDPRKIAMFPVADPTLASTQQKMMNAQFVQAMMQMPGIDPIKATQFILLQSQIPDIESILADPNKPAAPNPQIVKIQADIADMQQGRKIEIQKLQLQSQDQKIEEVRAEADAILKKAQAINQIAMAEGVQQKNNLQDIQLQLAAVSKQIDAQLGLTDMANQQQQQQQQQGHEQQMQANDQQHQQQLAAQQQQAEAQNAQQSDQAAPEQPAGDDQNQGS